MIRRKDLEDIIKHYGKNHQEIKAIEEMSELIQALSKHLMQEDPIGATLENVKEEIADVKVMVDQLMIIYGEDNIIETVKEKIERQKERMRYE